jgi:hypothetical protein
MPHDVLVTDHALALGEMRDRPRYCFPGRFCSMGLARGRLVAGKAAKINPLRPGADFPIGVELGAVDRSFAGAGIQRKRRAGFGSGCAQVLERGFDLLAPT